MFLKSLLSKADGGSRGVEAPGFEPQDEIMRFEGRFSSRLVTAFAPLVDSNDHALRLRAAEDELKFLSAALDIAVGPAPEINLLDMVTLVALGRDAMAKRYTVHDHGAAAAGLAEAFQASLDDVAEIARGLTSDDVESQLSKVIAQWQAENPDQEDVTSVRLSAFGERRPTGSEAARNAAGLLTTVRGAARTADNALLLAERALYAVQRLPFLVRTHARIAGSELFADLARNVDSLVSPAGVGGQRPPGGRELGGKVERSIDRMLIKAVMACGGVAIVTATSWLFARLAYRRLATRW